MPENGERNRIEKGEIERLDESHIVEICIIAATV